MKYIPGVSGSMIPEEAAIVIFKAQSNVAPQPVVIFNQTDIFIRKNYIQNNHIIITSNKCKTLKVSFFDYNDGKKLWSLYVTKVFILLLLFLLFFFL